MSNRRRELSGYSVGSRFCWGGHRPEIGLMLSWRNVLIVCAAVAYLAWSANRLLHDPPAAPPRPHEWDPQPVIVEDLV